MSALKVDNKSLHWKNAFKGKVASFLKVWEGLKMRCNVQPML